MIYCIKRFLKIQNTPINMLPESRAFFFFSHRNYGMTSEVRFTEAK